MVTDNLHRRNVYVHKNYSFGVIYVVVIAFIQRIRAFEDICGTKKVMRRIYEPLATVGPRILGGQLFSVVLNGDCSGRLKLAASQMSGHPGHLLGTKQYHSSSVAEPQYCWDLSKVLFDMTASQ